MAIVTLYIPTVPNIVAGEGIRIDESGNTLTISHTFVPELFASVKDLPNDPQEKMIYLLANDLGIGDIWE